MAIPEKRREFLFDFLLGILIPAIVTFIILLPLYSKPGYIFHGDEGWYQYSSISVMLKLMFYAWHGGPQSSNNFFFSGMEIIPLLLGSYFANHAMTFLLAFLPGLTSYFSIKKILNLIYPSNSLLGKSLTAIIGSVFYLVNWQNSALTNPTISWSFSYIILPVLMYLVLKIYKERKLKDIFLFALVSMFGDAIPDWIVFMLIGIVVILVALLLYNIYNLRKYTKYLLTSVWLVLATFAANAYSFIEILGGFVYKAGGVFLVYGSPSSEIGTARGNSFYHLIDVLMFGHSTFYSFGLNPKNWSALNVCIILSAIAIFLYILYNSLKKNRWKLSFISPLAYSLYFLILITISLFLAKGFNPPLGSLYKYVILFSPPGIVGITYDVGPWFILAALSYSFLFSIGLYYAFFKIVYEPPDNKEGKDEGKKSNSRNFFDKDYFTKSAAFVIIVILLGGAIAAAATTTDVTLKSYTYPAFSPMYYPQPYAEVNNYIESMNPNAYVTWIPYNGAYSWEDNYSINNLLGNLGGDLTLNFVDPQYLYSYLENNSTTNLANLLTVGNIKYLIIDQSGVSPVKMSFQNLINLIKKQSSIKLVYQYSWLTVFENEENFSIVQVEPFSNVSGGNISNASGVNSQKPVVDSLRKISPVQYTFNYYSRTTALVIFHQVYSNMWLLTLNGVKYEPIPLYNGSEMGFIVEKGYGQATLYYELQTYFYVGGGISSIFVVFTLWYFFRDGKFRINRRDV